MRITPSSFKLYGVIGYPLKHTLSPAMHQAAFRHLVLPCFYLALELRPADFRRLMARKKKILLEGFNLTVPHKQIVLPYLDQVSPEARAIGAVNTVIRRGPKWIGENTDAYGFLKSLRDKARWNSRGKNILILGAGGAARAAVYALCRDGARQITILNRTLAKAQALATDFGRQFPKVKFAVGPLAVRNLLKDVSLVVNTTSVGLKSGDRLIRKSDFPRARGIQWAYDLIYNPSETHFLKSAKQAGWKTLNGLEMLLHQGARSFELWTGKPAPIDVMRSRSDLACRQDQIL